jgi:hypothetical protein
MLRLSPQILIDPLQCLINKRWRPLIRRRHELRVFVNTETIWLVRCETWVYPQSLAAHFLSSNPRLVIEIGELFVVVAREGVLKPCFVLR